MTNTKTLGGTRITHPTPDDVRIGAAVGGLMVALAYKARGTVASRKVAAMGCNNNPAIWQWIWRCDDSPILSWYGAAIGYSGAREHVRVCASCAAVRAASQNAHRDGYQDLLVALQAEAGVADYRRADPPRAWSTARTRSRKARKAAAEKRAAELAAAKLERKAARAAAALECPSHDETGPARAWGCKCCGR